MTRWVRIAIVLGAVLASGLTELAAQELKARIGVVYQCSAIKYRITKCANGQCDVEYLIGNSATPYMTLSVFSVNELFRTSNCRPDPTATATPPPSSTTGPEDWLLSLIGFILNWPALIGLVVAAYIIYRWVFNSRERLWKKNNEEALKVFGNTPQERAAAIDDAFDKRSRTIEFTYSERTPPVNARFGRSIAAMAPREREALRISYQLGNLGMQSWNNFYLARLALVYGEGKSILYKNSTDAGQLREALAPYPSDTGVNLAMQDLMRALEKHPSDPRLRKLKSSVMGDGGELSPGPPLKAIHSGQYLPNSLILGQDEDSPNTVWCYDGDGSLVTIAPPRTGKTESQVIPNLLNWKGAAVVLDIKGEIYGRTSKWRQQNGPVFRFSPLEPANSHCFNPLSVLRSDPEFIWQDARTLADLMIVPSTKAEGNAKFFENKARDVVQAAIAYVCVDKAPDQRPLSKVIDIIHGMGWNEFVAYLQARVDISSMARAGHAFATTLEPKVRADVLQTAQESLSAWSSDSIEKITKRSDWDPLDLRKGTPTIYICVNATEIESALSVLRVFIGLHIRALEQQLPPRGAPPILFLLDEFPRLKHMPPIEEALQVGAGYGIKLWMFAQDQGQLKVAYPNPDGLMQNCAVRMYMNPDLQDETAQKLSEDIGYRESIIDGNRVRIVEPNVLAGPDFKDFVIIMARGSKPARLRKNFAYGNQALAARMGSL